MKIEFLGRDFNGPHHSAETIGDIPGLYAVFPPAKYGENDRIAAGKSHCLQTKMKLFEKMDTWQQDYEIFICYMVRSEERHRFVKELNNKNSTENFH